MINLFFLLFTSVCIAGLISNSIKDHLVRRVIYTLVCASVIAFVAFRGIGTDQDSIAYLFYYNLDDERMSLAAEPSFVIISNFTRSVFGENGFRWMLIIYGIVGVSIKFFAIRKITSLLWLSVVTYISYYFLLHEFTQIRAGIASGLFLLSLYYVYEKNFFAFMVIIILASLFHYSALATIPVYFLRREITLPVKALIGLAIPAGFVARAVGFDALVAIPIELITGKIEIYSAASRLSSVDLNVLNAPYIVKYAALYFLLIFSERICKKSAVFPILLQTYAISMFVYIAFSFNIAVAMRMSELFGVVEIVLFPTFIYAFRYRIVGLAVVLSLAIGQLSIGIFETELIQSPLH